MKLYLLFFAIIINNFLLAAPNQQKTGNNKKRLNFFISVKTKKIDFAYRSAQFQARYQRLFHRKEMYCVFAQSASEMASKMIVILKKEDAMVGNIWFDSHGHFNRRKSLFTIGEDEFNSQTINDSVLNAPLREVGKFCDIFTKAGIGSCYGGATYTFPAMEDFSETRMNGDSLMIGLGKILNNATVYASESFVMTKPGIFFSGFGFAGYPLRKKFKDPIYKQVWEHLDHWNCYDGKTDSLYKVNTVALRRNCDIYVKQISFLSKEKNRKKLSAILKSSKKGNYNIASLYQDN